MLRGISEILAEANSKKKNEEVIAVLQHPKYNTFALRHILRLCYDPAAVWLLPEGPIQYKPCPYLDQYNMLYQETKKLYLFLEGGNPNLSQERRETLFVQLLESLQPEDAQLMLEVKDKKITTYKKITKELVLEAFPGLF